MHQENDLIFVVCFESCITNLIQKKIDGCSNLSSYKRKSVEGIDTKDY